MAILLLVILPTAYATDDFLTLADQAKEAYKAKDYKAVFDYLEQMQNIIGKDIGIIGAELEGEQPWKKVASWEGNGLKNTESFRITSDEWRIRWINKGSVFQIFVYPEGSDIFFQIAANTFEAGSDVSYFYEPGVCYLFCKQR